MNLVLGIEPFKMAQIYGVHSSKKKALNQLNQLEKTKNNLCCQRFAVMNKTEIKKNKLQLFS